MEVISLDGGPNFWDHYNTSHAAISSESITVNQKFSNGNFIRGIYPISHDNHGNRMPIHGGEIYNEILQGTFHIDNTYSGTVSKGNSIRKGVFSFKETPDGVLFEQLSGTEEISLSDGLVTILQRPKKNDLEEGEVKEADGSVQKGIFRVIEEDDGIFFKQISGTFDLKIKDGTRVGTVIEENITEMKETKNDGSFREGVFYTGPELKTCKFFRNQYSGHFKIIRDDGVFEGRILSSDCWEGSVTYADGSVRKGIFQIEDISPDEFNYIHIAGSVEGNNTSKGEK